MLEKMNLEINIIKIKKMKDGSFIKRYRGNKITSDWFLWMHHTVNEIPSETVKKYSWQKKVISQNLSGSRRHINQIKYQKKQNLKNYETWKN